MSQRPTIAELVKEAVQQLGGKASNAEIKRYIRNRYGGVNENSIAAHIILCTVNRPSRINYPQNQNARIANDSRYDTLFSTGWGQVELYDPQKHGTWEIRRDIYGKPTVGEVGSDGALSVHAPGDALEVTLEPDELAYLFPLESHLRDFIARNIKSIKIDGRSLELYIDERDDDGVEYPTGVGPIDILAVDEEGNFVVFELKLGRGPDRAMGQIMRYMGWVKQNLADGKKVGGVIVASSVDEKLRYAASVVPQVSLFEYEIKFDIREVKLEG